MVIVPQKTIAISGDAKFLFQEADWRFGLADSNREMEGVLCEELFDCFLCRSTSFLKMPWVYIIYIYILYIHASVAQQYVYKYTFVEYNYIQNHLCSVLSISKSLSTRAGLVVSTTGLWFGQSIGRSMWGFGNCWRWAAFPRRFAGELVVNVGLIGGSPSDIYIYTISL